MQEKIQEILEDIYAIDPELKNQEKKLIKIMDELIKRKPDTHFDEEFKEKLKQEVLMRADQLTASFKNNWWEDFFQIRNLAYVSAGAALALLIALPLVLQNSGESKFFAVDKTANKIAFESGINNLPDRAFGSLSGQEGDFSNTSDLKKEGIASGFGGGGAAIQSPAPMLSAVESEGKMVASDSRMTLPYEPEKVEYKYIFDPEDIVLPESLVAVYKQVNSQSSAQSMGKILNGFDLGVIDLNNFSAAEVKSVRLAEEKDFGYYININLEENSVNINQNWEKWPRPDRDCRDEACFKKYRLKISDVPSDKKIIDLASNFIEKMGVDLRLYGEPEVDRRFEKEAEISNNQEVWVPETLSVVYPLRIENQDVHDYSGRKSGLNVFVDIRNMKVSGLSSLKPYNFEASNYEAVDDLEKVKEIIEQGDRRYHYGIKENQAADKIVEISLGKPIYSLLRYHNYNQKTRQTDELLIPAMILPVEKISDNADYFWQEAVVIPLVKEIFEKDFTNIDKGGRPEPMPLLRGSVEPMIESVVEPVLFEE